MTSFMKHTSLVLAMTLAGVMHAQAETTSSLPTNVQAFQQWLKANPNAKWRKPGTTTVQRKAPSVSRLTTNTGAGDDQVIEKPLSYEASQQAILDTVPQSVQSSSPEADAAFQAMMAQNMPMSPTQVIKMHQQIDLAQRAAAMPANVPPKPVSSTIMINLAPGTTPPAVRLAQGYVTSLVFVDSTGQPWPIASFDIGNPKAVSMQWDGKSNVLLMQALTPYTMGDMVVRLVGLPTPITLEMIAGQRVVDYRVDLHVSGIGPNTKDLPLGTNLPNSANQLLLGVLDGLAPAGSKALSVTGADSQAWLLGEKMYLRTRLTVLSPGFVGKMVSPDGMIAYELPKTSSVLVSRFGEPAEIKIEGF